MAYPGLVNGHAYVFGVWGYNAAGGYGPGVTSNIVSAAPTDPMAGAGDRSFFTYDGFGLSDRSAAKVNLGTGNLEVAVTDLVVPTVGGSLPIGRIYNSMAGVAGATVDYSGQVGYDWAFNQAPDVRLVVNPDPSRVLLVSPSGATAPFVGTAGATSVAYTTPPGLDSTLVRTAADSSYTLTSHAGGEVLRFRADGQLLSDADAYNNTLNLAYPDGRRPAAITGTAGTSPGNSVTLTYNGPNGLLSSMAQTADGATRTVSYTYTANQQIYQVTDAAGGITTFAYDSASNLSQITGPAPLSAVTKFGYDASHRVTSVTRVIGAVNAMTAYDYSIAGHTKVTDADGHPAVDYAIDGSGRVSSVTDPKNPGSASLVTYTSDNKVQTSKNGVGGLTTNDWSANAGESLKSTSDPTGAARISNFGNSGTLAWSPDWVADTMANQTSITYNGGVGDAQTVKNMISGDWALALYNADGTVSSSTDPNNITTTPTQPTLQDTTKSTRYSYFATHQLQTVTPPTGTSLGAQSFTYDGAGRLKTATSGKGVVTTNTYDNLDRITNQAFSDGTHAIATGYDANGNVTSRTDASGSTSWLYDAANRLKTKTLPGGAALGYLYDPAGNMISSTDAGGTTNYYYYDKVNELDQITEPVTLRTDVFAYDADHRLTDTWTATNAGVTYDASGNTVVAPTGFASHIRRAYDTAGNLTNIRTTRASSDAPANRLADIAYAYAVPTGTSCAGLTVGTKTNKRQRATDQLTNKTTDYCDDSAGRLTSAVTSGGPTYTYGYDKDSNRVTDAAGTHTFNAANQLTDTGTTYDADGNLTVSGAFPTLAYNGIGQTTAVTPAGQAAVPFAYAGAGQGERTSAGTTTAQNGALGVQTETTGGATTSYISGPGGKLVERTPGGDFYFYFDGLGSVIGLVDAATGTSEPPTPTTPTARTQLR